MVESVFKQCQDAVVTTIQGLSLTAANGRTLLVKRRKRPYDKSRGRWYPDITVSPEKVYEDAQGTNADDDHGYGCQVTFVASSSGSHDEDYERFLKQEEQIRNSFSGQRLSGVVESWVCWIRPAAPFDDKLYESQDEDVSSFVVVCYARELVRS